MIGISKIGTIIHTNIEQTVTPLSLPISDYSDILPLTGEPQSLNVLASIKYIYDFSKHDIYWRDDLEINDRVLFMNRGFSDEILTFTGEKFIMIVEENRNSTSHEDGDFTFDENTDTGWVCLNGRFVQFSASGIRI